MTETQERFLRSVLTRVSLDTVVELHLFPPIRRGTMETGVAVIATHLPPAPLTVVDTSTLVVIEPSVGDAAVPVDDVVTDTAPAVPEVDEAGADVDAVTGETHAVVSADADAADAPAEADATDVEDASAEADSPYADDAPVVQAAADAGDEGDTHDVDETVGESELVESVAAPVPAPRLRILTAAYRHTIKGIDRGKWAVDVQDEADAPLEAVEAVLRGVRHRSTEPADPELVSLDALAALLEPARVAPAA